MRLLQRTFPLWLLFLVAVAAPAQARQGEGATPTATASDEEVKYVELAQNEPGDIADKLIAGAFIKALEPMLKGSTDSFVVKVEPKKPGKGWQGKVNDVMGTVNGAVGEVFFYDVGGVSLGEATEATSSLNTAGAEALLAAITSAKENRTKLREDEAETLAAAAVDTAALQAAVNDFVAKADSAGDSLKGGKVTVTIPAHHATGAEVEVTIKAHRSGVPLTVLWLVLGAIFFTVRMGFVQLRALRHAVKVTRGDYDNPDDEGEVSHFQALTAALSATVGLGNIAGVAIAISIGGPGATVWMIVAGFLGMASKFTECTLGQMYRKQRPDGSVMGGAMYYLSDGLREKGMPGLGRFLAVMFAILCIGGSLAGGNSFQVNQSLNAVKETIPFFGDYSWVYGLIMTAMVAAVILGGLRRIAQTAEKIVPTMCGIYVMASLIVILMHSAEIPAAFSLIFESAMTPAAGFGGMIGVLVQGFKRAAFSNEAGVGSAAIAHSAAKTEYPVREGIVALLEPLIDTIIVCTMTALVIVVTGAYDASNPVFKDYITSANGAGLTSRAFGEAIWWFPPILSIAVVLFAFSTMISWSYYGERCWVWLFGDQSSLSYKMLFLVFVFLGSVITATNVLEFGDLMILGMALPNILGVILLSGKVRPALDTYMSKLKSGEMKTYK